MDWLHGILNLIGLLFWVLWRAGTMPRPKPANHIAGRRRQGTIFKHRGCTWLVVARRAVFHQFAPAWTGSSFSVLHESPHFRSDFSREPWPIPYWALCAGWGRCICCCLLATIKPEADTAKMRSFCAPSSAGWAAYWHDPLAGRHPVVRGLHLLEAEWMNR